ncbi:hypothetical protein ACFLX4_03775 [Chloroflexota bacterium]
MSLNKKLVITLFLSLVFLPVTTAMADSVTVSSMSQQSVCRCGY